jgi:hypothetical protein
MEHAPPYLSAHSSALCKNETRIYRNKTPIKIESVKTQIQGRPKAGIQYIVYSIVLMVLRY